MTQYHNNSIFWLQKAAFVNTIYLSDLVGRVRNGETPPFRPSLPADEKVEGALKDLMRECWMEEPSTRPDLVVVKSRFNALSKGK